MNQFPIRLLLHSLDAAAPSRRHDPPAAFAPFIRKQKAKYVSHLHNLEKDIFFFLSKTHLFVCFVCLLVCLFTCQTLPVLDAHHDLLANTENRPRLRGLPLRTAVVGAAPRRPTPTTVVHRTGMTTIPVRRLYSMWYKPSAMNGDNHSVFHWMVIVTRMMLTTTKKVTFGIRATCAKRPTAAATTRKRMIPWPNTRLLPRHSKKALHPVGTIPLTVTISIGCATKRMTLASPASESYRPFFAAPSNVLAGSSFFSPVPDDDACCSWLGASGSRTVSDGPRQHLTLFVGCIYMIVTWIYVNELKRRLFPS